MLRSRAGGVFFICTLSACTLLSLFAAAASPDDFAVAPGSVVRWTGAGTSRCAHGERSWAPRGNVCFYPIPLRATGTVDLVRVREGIREVARLAIGAYPYSVQHLHIEDESKVHLSPESLARVERENRRIAAVFRLQTPARFELPLLPPLEPLPPGGRFGAKRIINGEPRSPHTGADYAVPQGTPVRAAAHGVVALAEEHFFGGNSVFLDHGDGLITMYLHLSEILAPRGSEVKAGQVIGKVGSTGRSTGPHLHFGIRWHEARVDPRYVLGQEPIPEIRP